MKYVRSKILVIGGFLCETRIREAWGIDAHDIDLDSFNDDSFKRRAANQAACTR